ncbi:pantoate--beta-alanine ligase [Hansschlegelia sp. KR7-227]|uniref:pantoate--beta-alanine ligase n=1 Tax=Hansschlegelia sp. KR7-227 TaxID=3400914 RepID=UPI003BFF80B1
MSDLPVVSTVEDARARIAGWRAAGRSVAMVPTMGALHAGHLSLIAEAARRAERVVVSIFVNPTQFAPHEDLDTYPRDLDSDRGKLADTSVALVYAPTVAEMYPDGAATTVTVGGPAEGLESVARPHFFAGVATVVAKLLIQCAPDVAVFGEKDYQQLAVVRRLVRDLALPVEIVAGSTVREADGLAMSSRNVYLSAEERRRAPALHAALADASSAMAGGREVEEALSDARRRIEAAGFAIDYLELRDAQTLAPLREHGPRSGRILVAARLGAVRLIDNVDVPALTKT